MRTPGFFHRAVALAQRHAVLVIVLVVAATVFFASFARTIRLSVDLNDLFVQKSEITEQIRRYGEQTVTTAPLFITVEAEDLYAADTLAALDAMTAEVDALDGVTVTISPFSLPTFARTGRRIDVVPTALGRRAPRTPAEIEAFRARLAENPLANNLVVSADGESLASIFSVELSGDYQDLLATIRSIVDSYNDVVRARVAGRIVFDHTTEIYLREDGTVLLSVATVIMALIFFIGFRTVRAVLLPLMVVTIATIWTLGFMSLVGIELSVITVMTPPLLITLGSSYSVHILNQYYRAADPTQPDWIPTAVAQINRTILLAALTTVIGFGGLLPASLTQIREFGVSTSVGIIICALLSLTLLPAVLSLLKPPTDEQRQRVTTGRLVRALDISTRLVIRFRWIIAGVFALILVVFVISLRYVRYETDITTYFRRQTPAIAENFYVLKKFGGFVPLNVTLEAPGGEEGYFNDPEVLRAIAAFQDAVGTDMSVAYDSSFVSYVRLMNLAYEGDYTVPDNPAAIRLVSRYFSTIAGEDGMDSSLVGQLVTGEETYLTVSLRLFDRGNDRFITESAFKALIDRIELEQRRLLPPDIELHMWGRSIAILHISESLERDQIVSFALAGVLIFATTWIAFRSLRYGIFALSPMLTGIAVNFIVVGLFSIPFDMVTVMFTSITIGVGVDFSIHLLIQLQRTLANSKSLPGALIDTLKHSGRPIALTSLSLVAGLLVLGISRFSPVAYFGILVAIALFTTMIGALIILPALLLVIGRRKVD